MRPERIELAAEVRLDRPVEDDLLHSWRVIDLFRHVMDREESALRYQSWGDVSRIEEAHVLHLERIAAERIRLAWPRNDVKTRIVIVVAPDREEQRYVGGFRPIEKACGHAVVLGEREPFP